MTTLTTDTRPVPDGSRFRRRVERDRLTPPPPRPVRVRKWETVPEWSTPTAEEWEAMPNGTRLAFTAGEYLYLTLERRGERWTVHARTEVPSRALAGLCVAPRVRVHDEDQPEADQ